MLEKARSVSSMQFSSFPSSLKHDATRRNVQSNVCSIKPHIVRSQRPSTAKTEQTWPGRDQLPRSGLREASGSAP